MNDGETNELVRWNSAGPISVDSPRFNSRIARGLAWLDAASLVRPTSNEELPEEDIELMFPDDCGVGFCLTLASSPDEATWELIQGSDHLRDVIIDGLGVIEYKMIQGHFSIPKDAPIMLVIGEYEGKPPSDRSLVRQFAQANVVAVDAAGLATCGADGIRNNTSVDVVRNLFNYRTLLALSLYGSGATSEDLNSIGSISRLQCLDLGYTEIEDNGLRHLEHLADLRHLRLTNSSIAGQGLYHLSSLWRLELLDLSENPIFGKHLVHLRRLKQLTHLDLSYSNVADDGFRHLLELPSLSVVSLIYTKVSRSGIANFHRQRPDVDIVDSI